MGLFSSLFKKKKLDFNTPQTFDFKLINEGEFEITVGQKLGLWAKPESSEIRIYLRGTETGEGLIGYLKNNQVYEHIKNKGKYTAVIDRIGFNQAKLSLTLIDQYVTKEVVRENRADTVSKPYKPKKNWRLRFASDFKFEVGREYNLGFMPIEQAKSNLNDASPILWVENNSGKTISDKNLSGIPDTIKTLRAINSDVKLKLIFVSKTDMYSNFEVQV